MIRPDRFDFAVFIMSYSVTALLLAQAVRCLSPALVIHHEHLVIRHCAFPDLAPIEIELSTDVPRLLEWLGLDLVHWQAGFERQHDFWLWMARLEPSPSPKVPLADSLIRTAWRTLVHSGADIPSVKIRHQPARIHEMERFRDWLRSGYLFDEEDQEATDEESSKADLEPMCTNTTFTIVVRTTIDLDHRTGTATKLFQDTKIERHEAKQDAKTKPVLDPEHPIPLDDFAQQALEYFGQQEAYDKEVAKKSVEATRVCEQRRRRAQNREFSQTHEDPAARLEKVRVALGECNLGP